MLYYSYKSKVPNLEKGELGVDIEEILPDSG